MKKVTEKDLSLDKQEVSNLNGDTGTRDLTNNELICESKVCTESHFEICCAISDDNDSCGNTCEYTKNLCHETGNPVCVVSNVPDCITPIPETKDCLE